MLPTLCHTKSVSLQRLFPVQPDMPPASKLRLIKKGQWKSSESILLDPRFRHRSHSDVHWQGALGYLEGNRLRMERSPKVSSASSVIHQMNEASLVSEVRKCKNKREDDFSSSCARAPPGAPKLPTAVSVPGLFSCPESSLNCSQPPKRTRFQVC